MNKKRILMLIIGLVLLISIIVGIGVSGILSPYERQIRLAYKFLEQGNYEEAILAFDKAIEIDVKRDKAYIGKADVYVARCDENTLEDMKAVLEIAYNQHYNDKNIVDAIIRLSDELISKEHSEWAIELLNFGYELTNDERINEHKKKLFDEFADGFLVKLYEMFESGDKEGVRKEIQSEKYLAFVKLVENNDYKYIYFPDKNKEQTGRGIALYYVDTEEYGNVFVYYGDFEQGKRSGTGTWAGANGIEYYWFEGTWSSDSPNGQGNIEVVKDESKIEKKENYSYALKIETAGTFSNGLHNGQIHIKQYMDNGKIITWNPITAVNGIKQQIRDETTDYGYLIAEGTTSDGEHASLYDDGSVNSILGFN